MSAYSIPEIATFWTENGGAAAAQVDAVAVSLAESGGNPQAVSPSSDYGLWQINQIHFAAFGVNAQSVLDPNTNARIAISLSGNGTNWAAWCTCWTDPDANCGHGFIANPQAGSPAGDQLATVGAVLGVSSPAAAATPSGLDSVNGAWTDLQDFLGTWSHNEYGGIVNTQNLLRGL